MRERIHLIVGAFATLFQKASANPLSLEQKLEILARCGLKLEAPFTVNDLLESWRREDFEKRGFNLVLVGLGMTEERPPWRSHCINAWHFDTESIADNGDYRRIAERMKAMAQGSLRIENIRDHVDVEGRSAWLAFEYRGQNVRIDCKVKDDWVDPGLFAHFVDLLGKSDPSKIYLYYDLHGQDSIIACVTRPQFAELKRAGIAFQPLH
ncbi:MAG: hypothetical protein DMF60_05330 [Acidobacteria bacterium]|nr:MAG: hypothetical protein DMF60_05330 [Acidobacteriota bacterium]